MYSMCTVALKYRVGTALRAKNIYIERERDR